MDSSPSSFESVDAFLKAVRSSKGDRRQAIEEELKPMLQGSSTYAVPPSLAKQIHQLTEQYGDEAWKQTAMFCICYWASFHRDTIQNTTDRDAAIWAMADLTTLRHCIEMIDSVTSFNGQKEWKQMLQEEVGQAVLEACEEQDITVKEWLDRLSDD